MESYRFNCWSRLDLFVYLLYRKCQSQIVEVEVSKPSDRYCHRSVQSLLKSHIDSIDTIVSIACVFEKVGINIKHTHLS